MIIKDIVRHVPAPQKKDINQNKNDRKDNQFSDTYLTCNIRDNNRRNRDDHEDPKQTGQPVIFFRIEAHRILSPMIMIYLF